MKRIINILGLTGLFFISFIFFVYMTFPYGVLKEAIATNISKETGYAIRIGKLDVGFPAAVSIEDISVDPPAASEAGLKIRGIAFNLFVLPLLWGQIRSVAKVKSIEGGSISLENNIRLLDVFGGNPMPSDVEFVADEFAVNQIVRFALSMAGKMRGMNAMLQSLLPTLGLSGALDGKVKLNLESSDLAQSTGKINLKFKKGTIKLDPTMGLQDQVLEKALVKASLKNGTMAIDKSSGVVSPDFAVEIEKGKIKLKPSLAASVLDMTILFRLTGSMKENFGVYLGAFAQGAGQSGQITIQLRGPFTRLSQTIY